MPECPVEAIFPPDHVPGKYRSWIALNKTAKTLSGDLREEAGVAQKKLQRPQRQVAFARTIRVVLPIMFS
jgi:hypothetical protein